jgi:hypothetical protein
VFVLQSPHRVGTVPGFWSPLYVVCSWLGNSPRIVQQSYLLVTEDEFAKAAGVAKVLLE